jgi:hypothetical protein
MAQNDDFAFKVPAANISAGSLVYHNGVFWTVLSPGTSGQVLSTVGSTGNPHWVDQNVSAAAAEGSVLYSDGTDWVALEPGTAGQFLSTAGADEPPAWASQAVPTAGQAQGNVLYHNGTSWTALTVGTAGQFLQTNGAGANPTWATQAVPTAGQAQGNVLYHNGTAWTALTPGTAGQLLQTGGAGANPAWANSFSISTAQEDNTTGVTLDTQDEWLNIDSVSLAAGTWSVSGFISVAGAALALKFAISEDAAETTSNPSDYAEGSNAGLATASTSFSTSIAGLIKVLGGTTSVYLKIADTAAVPSATAKGRISAIKIA